MLGISRNSVREALRVLHGLGHVEKAAGRRVVVTAGAQGGAVLILGFLMGGTMNWPLTAIVLYIIIMALVFSITIPRGKVIGQALGAALGQGKITPELTAAMNDKTLNINFIAQDVLIFLILILMVLKPF